MLGEAADFDPKHKEKRWVAFLSSSSRYSEELQGEIIRMEELFEWSSVDACNPMGRMKRGIDVVVNWLSYWL